MNENENNLNGFSAENTQEQKNIAEENVKADETPVAPSGVTFDFPKPPTAPNTVPSENVYSQANEEPKKETNEFNPYAAPKMQSENFGNTTYHYNSANMPHSQENERTERAYTQQTYQPDQNFQPPYQFNTQPNYQPAPEPPKKKGKGKKIAAVIIAVCVVIAIAAMVLSLSGGNDTPIAGSTEKTTTSSAGASVTDATVATTQTGLVENVNSVIVAEKVRPSVVGVMTYSQGQLAGEGSGVLWLEQDGYTYVITCAHVINESGVTYGVMLLDGRTFEAELVAADTRTDIGVLKVEATGLPLAEIGNSSSLKIGEPVYAIGNPGGSEYFGSMTDGIVSSIDRSISSTYTMTVIQHNAAINPGNSGGALVNTAGQVIGINSSKIASTDYEGMGFAVPMSIALPVAQALVQYNYVPNRPKLGIEYASVSSYQLYSMVVSIKGLPQGSLVIAGISSDSSLANTEAEVGDLIIGVNGKDMDDSSVLLDLIDTGAVGDTLTLTLCRIESRTYKTTTFDVTITLVEDKGTTVEETTTEAYNDDGYYYGGASDFEDFFNDYFGFGW